MVFLQLIQNDYYCPFILSKSARRIIMINNYNLITELIFDTSYHQQEK